MHTTKWRWGHCAAYTAMYMVLCWLTAQPTNAQSNPATKQAIPKRHTIALSGTLTDHKGQPIQGAKVALYRAYFPQEKVTATTDAKGHWKLAHKSFGGYWLRYKHKQYRYSRIFFLLTKPQKIRVNSAISPKSKTTKAKPKTAKAKTNIKKAVHAIHPMTAGVLNRLITLHNDTSRKASRAFRASFMSYKKNKRRRFSRFTYPWKPYLAQVNGQLMVSQDTHERHALRLLKLNLLGHYPPYKERKKERKQLRDSIPFDSPAWSVTGSRGFRSVTEYPPLRDKAATIRYVKRFLQGHPNPGLRMEVHYRSLWMINMRLRFGKRRFKQYRKAKDRIDARWKHKLRDTLRTLKGKVLDDKALQKLQHKLQTLAFSYTQTLITSKKLSYFHRRSYYLRYIYPHLNQSEFQKKRQKRLNAIAQLAKRYPSKRFDKRHKRAQWIVNPKMVKGRQVPPFKMALLQNKAGKTHFTQDDFRKKHTLLIFWATWCGPCVKKMPMLHKLHKKFGPLGLQMVSISIDKKPEKVHAYRKAKWPIPWTNAILSTDKQRAVSDLFEVSAIPRMFLVGPQGTVTAVNQSIRRKKQLFAVLHKLFPTKPTSKPTKARKQPTP